MDVDTEALYQTEDDEIYRSIDTIILEQTEAQLWTKIKEAKIYVLVKDFSLAQKAIVDLKCVQQDYQNAIHNYHEWEPIIEDHCLHGRLGHPSVIFLTI